MKKIRYILFLFLIFIFIMGIVFLPNMKKVYKNIGSVEYSTAQIEGFEKSLFGSTGWVAIELSLKESANSNSSEIVKVSEGQAFTILGEVGNYWEILYTDSQNVKRHGYIEHAYCMINLPDVIPSIAYNITNAYSSVYRTRDDSNYIDIPDVTGQVLYGKNCDNGICEKINGTGRLYNSKIERDEFIVPSLYSAAKKIAKAQVLAKADGYSLLIYDSYRPFSVSEYVASKFNNLFESNTQVQEHVLHSYGANTGTRYDWTKTYFIAQVSKGSHISAHNVGSAIDVTLCKYEDGMCNEVNMFTPMHQLSTDSIKYYSKDVAKVPSNYSGGMLNDENARRLDNYMIDDNVGMGTLASEWWHFEDTSGRDRLTTATHSEGCDFQATEIVSTFGYTGNLYTVGDVNGDGVIDSEDAELIYKLYKYLQSNSCETCGTLIQYSDTNGDGTVNLDDVYSILNNDNDLISSSYSLGDDYIDVGYGEFNSSNVTLKNISNVSSEVSNNNYLIKYHDEIIKSYDIVKYSYIDHDLSRPYIYLEYGLSQINADITANNFKCVNCIVDVSSNNKVFIKKSVDDNQNLASYDLVYYMSDYSLDDSNFNSNDVYVSNLLSKFQCINCQIGVYKNSDQISSGTIESGSQLIIKETISGNLDIVKNINIILPVSVSGVELDESNINLKPGNSIQLSAIVSPNDAFNKNVTWLSSDTNIATVDNGLVTAVGLGETIITVRTVDGEYTSTCNVIVTDDFVVTYRFDGQVYTQLYEEGSRVNFKSDLIREGYILKGWRYNNQNYALTDTLYMPANDIEFIPNWEMIIPELGNDFHLEKNTDGFDVVTGIRIGTSVDDIDLGLPSIYSYSVDNKDGWKTYGKICTGDEITVYLNTDHNVVVHYTVSIKGDINEDGEISVSDISMIYKKIKRKTELNKAQSIAANVNGDGGISISDISMIYKHIKHKINIFDN